MAHEAAVHLTALCAVLSFLWVSHAFEEHSLVEKPRWSSVLVLFISGLLCFVAGLFSTWLPGANGRFDEEAPSLKAPQYTAPKRPRRFFFPCLIFCVVLRLELLHYVSSQQQCAGPGVESFLPLLLVLYEAYSARRPRYVAPEPDDPWVSFADDLRRMFAGSLGTFTNVTAVLSLCYGTYLAASRTVPSTYFCSAVLDSSPGRVFAAQLAGLLLDAGVVILVWRVLSWAKTTKARLSTLGTVLIVSAGLVAFLLLSTHVFGRAWGWQEGSPAAAAAGMDSPYLFDVVVDGAAVGVLVVSVCLVMCETSPMTPAAVITLVIGIEAARGNVDELGTWRGSTSCLEALVPLCLVCIGYVLHLYVSGTRSVVFVRRGFVLAILFGIVLYATVAALARPSIVPKHPLGEIMSDARTAQERWERYAAWSMRVDVAAAEYRKRNGGRDPPAGFDRWFDFAKAKKSVVIDHFEQIGGDLLPYWGMSPAAVRERIRQASEGDGMATLSVKSRVVSRSDVTDPEDARLLDGLVGMIESFAEHLPDMEIPVNLGDRPRVLATWDERQALIRAAAAENGSGSGSSNRGSFEEGGSGMLSPRRWLSGRRLLGLGSHGHDDDDNDGDRTATTMNYHKDPGSKPKVWAFATVKEFQRAEALACPPRSRGRSGAAAWNVRDFCVACAEPHSQAGFLLDWDRSLDTCAQPDLAHLHGFHMTAPTSQPFRGLLPVFSRVKTGSFSDIVIPLPDPADDDREHPGGDRKEFGQKQNDLYWRGEVGRRRRRPISAPDLRGNQAHRLVRLVNNASAGDSVTVLVPSDPRLPKEGFRYAEFLLADASEAIPLDVGISGYGEPCPGPDGLGDGCAAARLELGRKPAADDDDDHRFRLFIDGDDGPQRGLLGALHGASAPVVATMFRTWYTERLAAWVHFVPLDLRLHGLHGTAAHFLGMRGQLGLGPDEEHPRGPERVSGSVRDGEWIAVEGRAWAAKALRPHEDGAVYLFRLLLEWGRLVSDQRDEMNYKL